MKRLQADNVTLGKEFKLLQDMVESHGKRLVKVDDRLIVLDVGRKEWSMDELVGKCNFCGDGKRLELRDCAIVHVDVWLVDWIRKCFAKDIVEDFARALLGNNHGKRAS